MHVAVPESRLRIVREGRTVRTEIPAKRDWFVLVFLPVWLCGWAAGEVNVPRVFLRDAMPLPAQLFVLVWLTFWTLGGVLAIVLLLWNLAGRERITLDVEHFRIRREIFGIGLDRDYALASMRRLRKSDPLGFFDRRRSWERTGLVGGAVAFDYGSATVRFGGKLSESEALDLIDALAEAAPKLVENIEPVGARRGPTSP